MANISFTNGVYPIEIESPSIKTFALFCRLLKLNFGNTKTGVNSKEVFINLRL